MKNQLIFFSFSNSSPTDGGMARNHAFMLEMKKRGAQIYQHRSVQLPYRIFKMLRNIMLLCIFRNKQIVILQTVLLKFIFPFALFRFAAFRFLVQLILNRVSKNNTVFIEINDLIYEQAIDLGLAVDETALDYESFIFRQPQLQFIFASQLMGEYAVTKYGLQRERTQTVINGAPRLNKQTRYPLKFENPNKIKYIYAGTLNKGRAIEELIEIFAGNDSVILILIGIDGDWIRSFNYPNIHYLGKFNEETALEIASQCDIGLIPYDEDKLYYNICYPTKNSFYIAAGIPILCTPLKESMRVFSAFPGTAFFKPLALWNDFIAATGKEEVGHAKTKVEEMKERLSWEFLLKSLSIEKGEKPAR